MEKTDSHKGAFVKFVVPVVFLAFIFLCSRIPALAESYMQHCYPVIATVLSFISRWFPFSLLDLLVVAAILLLLFTVVMMVLRKWSFRRWIQMILLSLLWILVWFYMAWGIGYFRPDFFHRFGIEQPVEDEAFFEALVDRYIDSLNHSYVSGVAVDTEEIDRVIEKTYQTYAKELQLPYPCGKRRTKYTLAEDLMTQMGVAGFFDPFFNEVQVNHYLLPISYPFTLAHEKAHQFGIASEAECNFYAAVVCMASDHPLVQYSGYLQTIPYLLGSLRRLSPDQYEQIFEKIDTRVIADFRAIQEHWQKALSPRLSAIQDKVYDGYLKTNKQSSGIRSYSEMAELLVAWEQHKNTELP